MKKIFTLLLISGVFFLLILRGLPTYAQKQPKTLTILYTNSINGEIDPCPT